MKLIDIDGVGQWARIMEIENRARALCSSLQIRRSYRIVDT